MRNIDFIREVTHTAAGQWHSVLSDLSIAVSDSPLRHTPCPACGGTDRFRFDDNERGAHICNQCGAGDGLDLIKKVNGCDTTEAAQLVAEVLGIDFRVSQTNLSAVIERRKLLKTERLQREQMRQEQAAQDTEHRRLAFSRRYAAMCQNVTQGESDYLKSKGLNGLTYPLLTNGAILLPLVDNTGAVTAAQTITSSGEKRLVVDSAKRGAFHAINATEQPQEVILAEGLATALSVHLMRPDALTICAVDAGNLLHVAIQMRQQYPQAKIIIAADNDHHNNQPNTGKAVADKAALLVAGWVARKRRLSTVWQILKFLRE
ncbi:toprim domain-containing protein [Escherichia coli]